MSDTTTYTVEILDTIAKRRNLEQPTGKPVYIHSGGHDELAGWLGCPLPPSERPAEHTKANNEDLRSQLRDLQAKNAKLNELLLRTWRALTDATSIIEQCDKLIAELKNDVRKTEIET